MKNMYRFCKAEELPGVIPDDLIRWLETSVYVDVANLKERPHGMGVFIRENLLIHDEPNISIAIVAQWETKNEVREVKYLRYHIFKGDMPDALLDDINFVAKNTKNPVWN